MSRVFQQQLCWLGCGNKQLMPTSQMLKHETHFSCLRTGLLTLLLMAKLLWKSKVLVDPGPAYQLSCSRHQAINPAVFSMLLIPCDMELVLLF